jgi:predicted glycogen debranching enzyme
MIQFDQQICTNLATASEREWLETNGIGGFASSTITGLNTRRYHALLTAATKPPVGRMVLLSKLEETLIIDGQRYELSVNQYPNAVHPQGYQYLKEFRLDPFPTFVYHIRDIEITKTVFMLDGENSTVIQYALPQSGTLACSMRAGECVLELRPLVAFRDYHATAHENSSFNSQFISEDSLLRFQPYETMPALCLAHDAEEVETSGYWYKQFQYAVERERGLDYEEDLFQPVVLKFNLNKQSASVIASTEPRDIAGVELMKAEEIARRTRLASAAPLDDEFIVTLTEAADQFIVARGNEKTVIAGYHWFCDWGRDTMIALPGLTLTTGRADVARSILLEFAQHTDRGMLPNRFPDEGEAPEYNTIDATLWFFEAVRALAEKTGNYEFVKYHLYATLSDILAWHMRGTRYGIKVDEDGLLAGGEEGVQLTWMDAKVGDYVVTPRQGKAVEIQALWYNALRVLEDFAGRFGDEDGEYMCGEMAARAQKSFNAKFWNDEAGCLYDCINGDEKDASIRPNQIFAVSLPYAILSDDRAASVVEVVERELLTPYGLRSLSPRDARYRPQITGDSYSRDTAYHQGTVWGWLMGAFITAYVKVRDRSEESRRAAEQLFTGFREHLSEAGLGQISEIFDGDAPHTPRGCIAQAWSVAELLRAACEDVYDVRPKSAHAGQLIMPE